MRPARPRPAVWWSATSTMPSASPWRASSMASAFVEPVSAHPAHVGEAGARTSRPALIWHVHPARQVTIWRAHQGPHRQPGRDRRPGHPRLQGDGHRHGGGVLRARPGRAARPPGRRGLRAGRPDGGRELPEHRADPRGHRAVRRRRRAPRLRLLLREHRLRPRHHRAGRRVHRPAARGHRGDGRQGVEPHRRRRRPASPGVPGTTEFLTVGRRGHRLRRRVTAGRSPSRPPTAAAAAACSVVASAEDGAGRARVGAVRGPQGLRARRVLRRALPHVAPPRRDADHRRHPRQRRVGRRARLLGPAAPPEADRGEPGAGLPRRDPPGDGRGGGEGGQGRAATTTPAPSSSSTRTASSSSSR